MSKGRSKILLTGGSGLLGSYLKVKADRPSHKDMDITGKPINWNVYNHYDLIIHAAAYTNVQGAEINKWECFNVNVNGTLNLLLAYPTTPIVYISSEYASNPINFYSSTKFFAEELIKKHPDFFIIRTLFKATPWPFEKAFIDQWTQGDSVDIIAPLIDKEIEKWDRKGKKMMYVGTGRKRIYDIAIKTRPDVIPNSYKEMKVPIPHDYQ